MSYQNINHTEKEKLSWEKVEQHIQEGTSSGNAMALVETEKIFAQVLKKLKFPGKTTDQRTEALKSVITDFNELTQARKIYKSLIGKIDFELENLDIKKILAAYYRAISDISKFHKEKRNFLTNIKLYLNAYFPKPKKTFKKLGIGLVIFFFIIFLLDSTSFGRSFVSGLVALSHFIFSWVLFTVILIVGVIIIILGSIFYFESRKKKKAKLRIED